MRRYLHRLFVAAVVAQGCQPERWELPASFGGSTTQSHNYTRTAAEPPRMVFLQSVGHPDTSGCLQPPLPLSSRLTVLATANGSLIALSAAAPQWTFSFPKGTAVASALAADTSTLYAMGSDGALYALSFNGTLRWRIHLFRGIPEGGGPYTHLLPFQDGIAVGDASGRLLRIGSSGAMLWEQQRGGSIERSPAADGGEHLVVGIVSFSPDAGDTILFIDPTGQQRWARALHQTRLTCSPTFGQGYLFVAGVRNPLADPIPVLHTFSETGQLLWSRVLPATPRWLSVDDSNGVYVIMHSTGIGEPISGILAYDARGEQRWTLYIRAAIMTPALIFRNSAVVFAIQPNGALGAYILAAENGKLQELLSLEGAPPLLLQPAVTPDGSILLGWSHRLGLLRLGEHPWQWLLF
ncbi:MAG: PQQ-like beta-propeller repeat protein [Candidatus Kapabacteria bacterium]|nr:PQQ-like beta-propeller repeat protein [Candidatus Kapabacteria bacterium]MCS7170441.1 PQQ-like beta-propeller repeat protein [Candidatus Kapabacteria bacterium]MDW8224729.1 PQQ-binding-like beta-propeller repeat protein [Bacteroidota bacterium]